jgi:hypothetical protein
MAKNISIVTRGFLLTGILTTVCTVAPLFAQVEHNYKVGPQSTNCDSLEIRAFSTDDAISIIKQSSFRYQQQFKISRTYGVMSASFFSCDGKLGYLIVKVEKKDYIYIDVPKSKWTGLISSADINGFYDEEINGNYEVITETND